MIIGIIGDYCSGKKTFIKIIKKINPNIIVIKSDNKSYDNIVNYNNCNKVDHNLEKYINKSCDWFENHKKIIKLLQEEEAKTKLNESSLEKEIKNITINDKIRNQLETIIIYNISLIDFKKLQNKAGFRLIKIDTNVKRRFENYKIIKSNIIYTKIYKNDINQENKEHEPLNYLNSIQYESSSNTDPNNPTAKFKYINNKLTSENIVELFEEFLDKDRNYNLTNKHNYYRYTVAFTICNNYDIDCFEKNIKNFWTSVTTKFRPNWNDYFMNVTQHVADRASCVKIKVGAIIVNNKRIVSTGFNGTPQNLPNCQDGYCPRCHKDNSQGINLDSCFCIHAEENAIVEVGKEKCNGATMYVTFSPCIHCSKLIIQSGIKKVVYKNVYNSEYSFTLLKCAGVIIEKYESDRTVFDISN